MSEKPRFKEILWSWKSKDSDQRVAYQAIDGRVSLADLIEHLESWAPWVPPDQIMLNFATVTWERPAMADELVLREEALRQQRKRQEEWERKTLARLLEKYDHRSYRQPITGDGHV